MPILWTMLRIKKTTRDRLEKLRNSLLAAWEKHHPLIDDLADGMSLDALVSRLLDQQERHVARAKKANARKKKAVAGATEKTGKRCCAEPSIR